MAPYKHIDKSLRFLAVDPAAQILPGSFEHALSVLIDQDITLEALMESTVGYVDSEPGREMIARRFATVEPVFGNLRHNKGLDRFSLRGRHKVDGQWKLYCIVHKVEKLAKNGYGS